MNAKLKWWRRRRGLTQAALARRAKLRQATISNIERGRIIPRVSTLQRLARVLRVPLKNLIG